jgi:hypothetical protein
MTNISASIVGSGIYFYSKIIISKFNYETMLEVRLLQNMYKGLKLLSEFELCQSIIIIFLCYVQSQIEVHVLLLFSMQQPHWLRLKYCCLNIIFILV